MVLTPKPLPAGADPLAIRARLGAALRAATATSLEDFAAELFAEGLDEAEVYSVVVDAIDRWYDQQEAGEPVDKNDREALEDFGDRLWGFCRAEDRIRRPQANQPPG